MKILRISPKLYCFILGLTVSVMLFTAKYEWSEFTIFYRGVIVFLITIMLGISYYYIRFYKE